MTDLQDLRSRLRDDVRRGSSSDEGGSSTKYILVIAVCGIVIGFALFLFVPRFLQSRDTAIMRDISLSRGTETGARTTDGSRYAGKNPDEVAIVADEVCAARVPARQPGKAPRLGEAAADFLTPEGMKRVNEQMQCLLTEGPMRFCSPSQRRMIIGELALYFRGIETANRAFGAIRGSEARKSVVEDVAPDPRVLIALEARLRDGQLTTANRDVLSSEAPRWVRDRLVKIEPRHQSLCPEKPWWAIWR
jgi:hypothetical protein